MLTKIQIILLSNLILSAHSIAECQNKAINVNFILDGSSSVGSSNFGLAKKLIDRISANFDLDVEKTWVSFEQYADQARYDIAWTYDQSDFSSQISTDQYLNNPARFTGQALNFCQNSILPYSQNSEIYRIVVFTTGKSSDDAGSAANQLRDSIYHPQIFAVGLGLNANSEELIAIASNPPSEYKIEIDWRVLENENDLERVAQNMASKICSATDCSCSHGVPVSGEECPVWGGEYCQYCEFGYQISYDYDVNGDMIGARCVEFDY